MQEHGTRRAARAIEHASDAIIGATTAGVVTSWNTAAADLLGYDEDEAIGHELTMLWPEQERAGASRLLARVAGGERVSDVTTEVSCQDGSGLEVTISASPISGDGAGIVGVSLLMREGSRDRSPDEKFRAMLESAPDAIVIVGTDGRIVLVNRQTEVVFGYDSEELLGEPIERLIPEEFRPRHGQHRARFFMKPNMRPMGVGLELYGKRKDGARFPVEISLSPIATEEGLVVSAAIRDISERKKAEEQSRHIEQMQIRRRQALELNDEIVQGLTVAKMAHQLGRPAETEEAITKTLKAAQMIISQMLMEEKGDQPLGEGGLVRERPAHLPSDGDGSD